MQKIQGQTYYDSSEVIELLKVSGFPKGVTKSSLYYWRTKAKGINCPVHLKLAGRYYYEAHSVNEFIKKNVGR